MTKLGIGLMAAALMLFAWTPQGAEAQAAPLSAHKALAGVKLVPVAKASHRQIRKRNRTYSSKRRYRKRLHRRYRGYRRVYRPRYGGYRYYYLYASPYYVERCRFLANCPCRYLAQC